MCAHSAFLQQVWQGCCDSSDELSRFEAIEEKLDVIAERRRKAEEERQLEIAGEWQVGRVCEEGGAWMYA